jgi:hypothetical protein
MSGLLADIYSAGDRLKRGLRGFLDDPVGTVQQQVGDVNDRARAFNELTAQAAQEPGISGPASMQLGQTLADAYNPAGIFIGPASRLWNKDAAFEAAKMAAKKVDPRQIWRETGTFKSPDKLWRQEIDDSQSRFLNANDIQAMRGTVEDRLGALREQVRPDRSGQRDLFPKLLTEARRPLKAEAEGLGNSLDRMHGFRSDPQYTGNFAPIAYDHPLLYQAYPELRQVVVRQGQQGDGAFGAYSPGQLDIYREGLLNNPRSTATHEMQHAVQRIEDFSRGGSPSEFAVEKARALDEIRFINNQLSRVAKDLEDPAVKDLAAQEYARLMAARGKLIPAAQADPYKGYQHLAGEAEARAVQKRLLSTPEERLLRFPLDDYDVNVRKLILAGQGQPLNQTNWLLD